MIDVALDIAGSFSALDVQDITFEQVNQAPSPKGVRTYKNSSIQLFIRNKFKKNHQDRGNLRCHILMVTRERDKLREMCNFASCNY